MKCSAAMNRSDLYGIGEGRGGQARQSSRLPTVSVLNHPGALYLECATPYELFFSMSDDTRSVNPNQHTRY